MQSEASSCTWLLAIDIVTMLVHVSVTMLVHISVTMLVHVSVTMLVHISVTMLVHVSVTMLVHVSVTNSSCNSANALVVISNQFLLVNGGLESPILQMCMDLFLPAQGVDPKVSAHAPESVIAIYVVSQSVSKGLWTPTQKMVCNLHDAPSDQR